MNRSLAIALRFLSQDSHLEHSDHHPDGIQQEATDVQKDCVVIDLGSSSGFITKYIGSFRQLSLSDFCCLYNRHHFTQLKKIR